MSQVRADPRPVQQPQREEDASSAAVPRVRPLLTAVHTRPYDNRQNGIVFNSSLSMPSHVAHLGAGRNLRGAGGNLRERVLQAHALTCADTACPVCGVMRRCRASSKLRTFRSSIRHAPPAFPLLSARARALALPPPSPPPPPLSAGREIVLEPPISNFWLPHFRAMRVTRKTMCAGKALAGLTVLA